MAQSNFSGPVVSQAGFLVGGESWGMQGGEMRSGVYYSAAPTSVEGAAAIPYGEMRGNALYVGQRTLFDRISINCTVAGDANAVTRLGVYNDDGAGAPGALLLDAGTVGTGTTGGKEITIALLLTPGLYWLMAVSQVGSTTAPTIEATSNSALPDVGLTTPSGSIGTGWFQTGVTGALPAVAAPSLYASTIPLVFLRAV